jgi:hypothetical protein
MVSPRAQARLEGPLEEESEREPDLEIEEEYGEDLEEGNEQDEPPTPEYHTPDEDHISPARRTNRGELELGRS